MKGGSGGALAIGVGDRILMLENSTYSVASPEAAAAILWRDASQASTAAVSMHITAPDLLEYGVIDEIIPEPDGGAHTDPTVTLDAVREAIARHLADLQTRLLSTLPKAHVACSKPAAKSSATWAASPNLQNKSSGG